MRNILRFLGSVRGDRMAFGVITAHRRFIHRTSDDYTFISEHNLVTGIVGLPTFEQEKKWGASRSSRKKNQRRTTTETKELQETKEAPKTKDCGASARKQLVNKLFLSVCVCVCFGGREWVPTHSLPYSSTLARVGGTPGHTNTHAPNCNIFFAHNLVN